MVLYHGSNMAVEQPDLNHSKTNLDFGAGFYTTSDLDQAKRWAVSTTRRRGTGEATVTVYRVNSTLWRSKDSLTGIYHGQSQAPSRRKCLGYCDWPCGQRRYAADHWNLFERNHHGEDVYTASEAAQIKESVYVQNRAGNRHAGVQGHNPELAVTEVEIWKGLCRTW